jgi:hypothetical protein
VITTPELHKKAAAEGIRFDQAEKDYVILWILYGLFQSEFMPLGWAFKGGTCLRHCYYPGYRFSEDLDFSCQQTEKGLEDALFLLTKVAAWIEKTSGIAMEPKNPQTIPGDFQVEIPMQYTRGGIRRQGLPHVKLHLTFDERILTKVATCSVKPLYSDLTDFEVTAYSKEEIVVEKMRALLQQQKKWPRPRDLYDLWFILHQAGEKFHWEKLKRVFVKKCQARGINPDLRGLISENLKERNKSAWDNQLGPLMKNVPEFDKVWNEWIDTFQEIFGRGEGWLNKY